MLTEGRVGENEMAPEHPTLIYDGNCGFCRRWVGRVRRLDRRNVVRYLTLQDAAAEEVSGRRTEHLQQAVHLVRPDGVVFAGAAAARELLATLPGGWLPYGILGLPGLLTVSARAYAWVARRYGPVRPPIVAGAREETRVGCHSQPRHADAGDA